MASEVGSHAWGHPSPDSDFDVRIIFSRSLQDHLDLFADWDRGLGFNEIQVKNVECNSWSLSKTLRHVWKSNVSVYDALFSPCVYIGDGRFIKDAQARAEECFNPVAAMHQYRSAAESMHDRYIADRDEVEVKRFMHWVRLVASAISVYDHRKYPGLNFGDVIGSIRVPNDPPVFDVLTLSSLKDNGQKMVAKKDMPELFLWAYTNMQSIESLARQAEPSRGSQSRLNTLFRLHART